MREALTGIHDRLGLSVTELEFDKLLTYMSLLERWNKTYNLTAVRDPAQMLYQHLADCLAVIAPLRRELPVGAARRVLDVGSGGGLPGVVIAILNADMQVTCVDAVGKKAAFIRQVAGELQLKNLRAEHARVEQLQAAPFDVITSRAFASLAECVQWTFPLLAPGGFWMAMKGRVPTDEISLLPPSVKWFHVEPLTVPGLDAQRCIVWLRPDAL